MGYFEELVEFEEVEDVLVGDDQLLLLLLLLVVYYEVVEEYLVQSGSVLLQDYLHSVDG